MTEEIANEIEQHFVDRMRSAGMNKHTQRLLVLRTFLKLGKEVTALDVLYAAKRADMTMSYTTVIRTMALIVDFGLAQKVADNRPGAWRNSVLYVPTEAITECPHTHMVCKDCGAVIQKAVMVQA